MSLQRRAGATPLEVASWGGHSPQVMFRHYAGVIEELVGEPQLAAEAQIELARKALRAKPDEEVAELVGSLVEQPTLDIGAALTAAARRAHEIFYGGVVLDDDPPDAIDHGELLLTPKDPPEGARGRHRPRHRRPECAPDRPMAETARGEAARPARSG